MLSERIPSVKPWEWDDAPFGYYQRAFLWCRARGAADDANEPIAVEQAQSAPNGMSKDQAREHLRSIGALKD